MNDDRMDRAIFSALSEVPGHWRKVAFVVGRVTSALGDDLEHGDKAAEAVAQRIEFLVSEGRLLVQGDIKEWRFSEVRPPS
jgi:Protein of unknown function